MILWSPDGYYTYLGIPKPNSASATNTTTTASNNDNNDGIDIDRIKKSYRKLSLKHHPDRSGGDADTFRVLNRAQKVLTNPKLRQQYDILGIDLDDDENQNDDDNGGGGDNNTSPSDDSEVDGDGPSKSRSSSSGSTNNNSASQGIVNEMAQMALTAVLQMGVRTCKLQEYSTNFSIRKNHRERKKERKKESLLLFHSEVQRS